MKMLPVVELDGSRTTDSIMHSFINPSFTYAELQWVIRNFYFWELFVLTITILSGIPLMRNYTYVMQKLY